MYVVYFDDYMIPSYDILANFQGNSSDIIEEFDQEIDAKVAVMEALNERIQQINEERQEAEFFLLETKQELAIIRNRLEDLE